MHLPKADEGKERAEFGRARLCSARCTGVLLVFVSFRLTCALGALGVQSSASHPGPGSYEAHPAGRMIGIGLRAREP